MARPRQYDEQVLLERAQDEFWVNGYDRTSIDDLAAATGVGNGSLYAAYGSKLGLFLAVFQRYCDGRTDEYGHAQTPALAGHRLHACPPLPG